MSRDSHTGSPSSPRRRCPTCNALRHGDAFCPRCKSDLTLLVKLEQQADLLHQRAGQCYGRGWYRQAAALADQVLALEACDDGLRLLACARLLEGDFQAALRIYVRLRRTSTQRRVR